MAIYRNATINTYSPQSANFRWILFSHSNVRNQPKLRQAVFTPHSNYQGLNKDNILQCAYTLYINKSRAKIIFTFWSNVFDISLFTCYFIEYTFHSLIYYFRITQQYPIHILVHWILVMRIGQIFKIDDRGFNIDRWSMIGVKSN
jgi:hypothetical protein